MLLVGGQSLRRALQVKPGVSWTEGVIGVSILMLLGIALFVAGAAVAAVGYRACVRIKEKSREEPNALTAVDLMFSGRFLTKRRKLSALSQSSPDASVRAEALEALHLDTSAWALVAAGLLLVILTAIG